MTSLPARSSSPTSSTAVSSPPRPSTAGSSSLALAVLIAYIHDVGMNDPTREGRRAHAIYAAQMPFSGAMDDVLARLWESGGPVVSRICSVGAVDPFRVPDDVVLRELASLALAHSKSMVPATLHADFSRFRSVLQQAVLVEFEEHRRAGARLNPDDDLPDALGANGRWYADPAADAFAWVDSPDPAHRALTTDAVDAVRLVRVADALRQRGSALRTAAGYEIFIDVETGQAVFSLRTSAGDRLFLLRFDSPMSAGEANLRKAVVTRNGDLRISFHRGRFSSPAPPRLRAKPRHGSSPTSAPTCSGRSWSGPRRPILPSRPAIPARCESSSSARPTSRRSQRPSPKPPLALIRCSAGGSTSWPIWRAHPRPSGRDISRASRSRPRATRPARSWLALETHGMRVGGIDRRKAFEDVRRVVVAEGELLVEAGSSPAFVYIPVGCSLRIEQLGGYQDIAVPPWIPIGVTGVVRRAERNSTVVTTEPGDALMIPGELFAREWFRPTSRASSRTSSPTRRLKRT